MFEPLRDKVAEPPPPKGVSTKEWDAILAKGPSPSTMTGMKHAAPVALIRKMAQAIDFQELTEPAGSTEDVILSMKLAAVEDSGLLETVYQLSGNLSQALSDYEQMGGTYKHAFGTPMFDSNQLAGSPAVASGMQMRATNQMQQDAASAAQAPAAPAPKGMGTTSAPSMSSPTSAPSSPTG